MALRKRAETPDAEKKAPAKAAKPAPKTYTADQQMVMAALGMKPE